MDLNHRRASNQNFRDNDSGPPRTHNTVVQCSKYIVNFTISSMVRTAEMSTQEWVKMTPKTAIFGQKFAPFEVKFHSENMPKMRGFSMEKSYDFPSKIHQKITRKSHGFRHSPRLKTTSETSSKVLENRFETTSKPLSKLFGKRLRNHLTGPFPRIGKPLTNPLETP